MIYEDGATFFDTRFITVGLADSMTGVATGVAELEEDELEADELETERAGSSTYCASKRSHKSLRLPDCALLSQ